MKKYLLILALSAIPFTAVIAVQPIRDEELVSIDDFEDPGLPIYDMRLTAIRPASKPLTSYVLRIRFPQSIKPIPTLCGYYKGYRLHFNPDYCLINENTPTDSFTLVIADEVTRRWQNNATKDLKHNGKKCRMFYITKKHGKNSHGWNVEEEDENNIPIVLPKTSIVIILDPDLISTIKKDDDLTKVKTSSHNSLYLPIIEIKPDAKIEELKDACNEAWCAAVDTRGVHSPVSSITKNDSSVMVAMNTLER